MLGSKIENLLKMKTAKINVPDFIVLSGPEDETKLGALPEDKKYAVRSSCNLEDGEQFSFAGQFDTYLNIDKADLREYVHKCFESLYKDNVRDYVENNGIRAEDIHMNVCVQDMVEAELAGVMFTANTQGILNESVIVVGEGLGDGIVSDRVDTVTYYYNLDDCRYYYEGKKELLSEMLVEKLIRISRELVEIFGPYLDIEFAIKNNEVFILQTRKITTIDDSNMLIMDNSNIVESYPGISLPLTCSFVNEVYTGVFKGVCRRVLKDEDELEKMNPIFCNMVGNSNGRLYYKISNWYQIIQCLPFSKKIIPIWQEMLGVKNKSVQGDKIKRSIFKRAKVYINFFSELKNTTSNMEKLNEEFLEINKFFYDEYGRGLTEKRVIELYNEVSDRLLACWDITLINDIYTFIYTALFKKRIKRKYPENTDFSNELIGGISNIESLKPIRELINLSYEYDTLSDSDRQERVKEYIELYGDRNIEELKLESDTFRTNQELLYARIEYYNQDKEKLKEMYENINDKKADKELKLDGRSKRLLKACRNGIKNREISRLNRSRIFGIVREMMNFMGKSFVEANIIDDFRDIYYLKMDEVFQLAERKRNMREVIAGRKAQYEMFALLPEASRIIFAQKEFDKNHLYVNSEKIRLADNTLKGTPCSNGSVFGEVLVIDGGNYKLDVKDKILVTEMTDPGWVFLLATAKGIISEKGSLLSHTAIISRELKIPSIVGVDNLLKVLHTGDYIRMNGSTGEIELIKRKSLNETDLC